MFQYITVFDPTRGSDENDMHQQLLLYHSFADSEQSLNDKLGKIGIIQGLWSLTDSLSYGASKLEYEEKVVQLDEEVLLIIYVESRFFICLGMREQEGKSIPHQFYLTHLWHCYRFFTLWNDNFTCIEDSRELTNLLNEHFVPFWSDLYFKPDTIVKKGIVGLWHRSHKVAELEFANDDQSWESIINQDVLLEPESYLGVKDVLVYHLPSYEHSPGYKTYGLIRHFSTDVDIITSISNWICHSHAVYGNLSSHVLASNTHYKEVPANSANATTSSESRSVVPTLVGTGESILHNLTLPISLACDAVQEVGATTGISNSISLVMDYFPKWNPAIMNAIFSGKTMEQERSIGPPHGYLISPLCGKGMPDNYKLRVAKSQTKKVYHCIFWYYRDVLVCIVNEPNFKKMYDRQYLEDLSYKLSCSMGKFYATAFPNEKNRGRDELQSQLSQPIQPSRKRFDPFGFALRDKRTQECRCSIPSWTSSNNEGRSYRYSTFLDSMPRDKLWELQIELVQLLQSLQNSRREKSNISEERLIRLGNGLVCFIRDSPEETALVVANWFDESAQGGTTLISGLGIPATRWWRQRSPSTT